MPYIANRSEVAVAGYALLETLAQNHQNYDAIIIGAFHHSFVPAAKELMPVPVLGIAEAALRMAQLFGKRISIIGIGSPERGMNEELISSLNVSDDIASIRILEMSGSVLTEKQASADSEVIRLGHVAVTEDNADVLVLGGAAFSGMSKRIQAQLPVPVLSPISCAVRLCEAAVAMDLVKQSVGTYRTPEQKEITGTSSALASFFIR